MKESGYQDQIDALTSKAKEYEKLLSPDRTDISAEEKAKINDAYNTVQTRLEEAKTRAEEAKKRGRQRHRAAGQVVAHPCLS